MGCVVQWLASKTGKLGEQGVGTSEDIVFFQFKFKLKLQNSNSSLNSKITVQIFKLN